MKRFADRLLYWLFYAFTWQIAMLPRPLFYFQSDVLALLLCFVLRYRRSVVRQNLERSFPEKSVAERSKLVWKFYRHLSDLILESFFLLHASVRRVQRRCKYTNVEILTPHYAEGKSVIVAAAHIANWEFLVTASLHISHHMLNVYKPLHNRRIEHFLTRGRERFGGTAVPMQNILRSIVCYEQKQIPTLIGLISDQTPPPGKHLWLEFFHQDTMVYTGVEKLACHFDFPVYFCRMERVRRGYYEVTLEKITTTPREEPENGITARYMHLLEETIRAQPSSWLWSHKRWKRTRE